MEAPTWQKALLISGGVAATAGLMWYLLREGQEEEAESTSVNGVDGPLFFKVTDPKRACIGIRVGPDVESQKTGHNLFPGEVFQVSNVIEEESGQCYLQLADMRGWAFTHSSRDGRLLTEPCSVSEAQDYKPSDMVRMAQEAQKFLAKNPGWEQKVQEDPNLRPVFENAETIWAAANTNPSPESDSAHLSSPGS